MMDTMTELRKQLEERNTEIEQLKANYESQRPQKLLQYIYEQLRLTNQKLIEDSKDQVSTVCIKSATFTQ